jgi:hypothetical protein
MAPSLVGAAQRGLGLLGLALPYQHYHFHTPKSFSAVANLPKAEISPNDNSNETNINFERPPFLIEGRRRNSTD